MIAAAFALFAAAASAKEPAPPPPPMAEPAPPPPPVGPDRSRPPDVKDPPVLPLAEPEVHALGPGVTAKFVRVPGIRKVAVSVMFEGGTVELDGRSGPVALGAGYLADSAAGPYTSAQLQELQDLREIDVSSWYGNHWFGVDLTVPKEELAKGLELLGHVVREPTFPKAEVKRWQLDQKIYYTVDGPASQAVLANSSLAYAWFPADHPYGVRPDLGGFASASTAALAARWTRQIHEVPVTIVAVGDVAWADLEPALTTIVAGLGRAGSGPKELAVTAPAGRVVVVNLPGQSQVAVRGRWSAPKYGDADRPGMVVANFFLGGAFLSRLNLNLREEKGFTYGARTSFSSTQTYGVFTVSVDVKAENLAATVDEITKELHRIATEPGTNEELVSARRSMAADWNRTLQTADQAVGSYASAHRRGLTMTELRGLAERVQEVELPEVQRVASTWFADEAPAQWVFVGDADAIQKQLAARGWKIDVVSPQDAMIGAF